MGSGRAISVIVAVCAMLSACNTTDALVPRADVGDESAQLQSAPVTQADTERMATSQGRQRAYASAPVESYPADNGQQSAQSNFGGSSAEASSGSLDAQANAIQNGGSNPYQSAPLIDQQQGNGGGDNQYSRSAEQREADRRLSQEPQPQQMGQARQDQARQDQAQDDQAQQSQDDQNQQEPPQQQASLTPSASADGDTIRFLPIIGAPVQAVTPLSRQLGAEARAHGLSIKSSTDTTSNYILKGYLTAFEDGPAITVSYVWDVLDNTGARLHRIQGTESAPLKGGDPWASIPPSVMQRVASKTIAEFSSWRQTRGG